MLISSSDDDQIVLYDCEKGTQIRTVNSNKYRVDLIHFTHANNMAIHSSTKVDDTIRYLSLHDNKYLRYFPGHTKKAISLNISPVEDTFLLRSLDKTMRLWELRSPNCQGVMNLNGRHMAAYDPEWLTFDAFHGTPLQTFTGHLNNKGIPIEAAFSRDSQFIFCESTDGRVHVWNADTGYKICVLNGDHPGPIQCVQFNSRFIMLASACTNMVFWLVRMLYMFKTSTHLPTRRVKKKQMGISESKLDSASKCPINRYLSFILLFVKQFLDPSSWEVRTSH